MQTREEKESIEKNNERNKQIADKFPDSRLRLSINNFISDSENKGFHFTFRA